MRFTTGSGYRLLLAAAVAAVMAGCAVAYKTDMMRKDVLTDAQQAVADAKFEVGAITVAGVADRPDTTYDPGQPINFTVTTSKDAYVAILRVLPNGDTAIVFPNRAQRITATKAGMPLVIPAPGAAVKIAADKPGVVLFEFITSTLGDAWPFKRAPDAGSDFAGLGITTRNIVKNLDTALRAGAPHDIAASHLTVRITGGGLF